MTKVLRGSLRFQLAHNAASFSRQSALLGGFAVEREGFRKPAIGRGMVQRPVKIVRGAAVAGVVGSDQLLPDLHGFVEVTGGGYGLGFAPPARWRRNRRAVPYPDRAWHPAAQRTVGRGALSPHRGGLIVPAHGWKRPACRVFSSLLGFVGGISDRLRYASSNSSSAEAGLRSRRSRPNSLAEVRENIASADVLAIGVRHLSRDREPPLEGSLCFVEPSQTDRIHRPEQPAFHVAGPLQPACGSGLRVCRFILLFENLSARRQPVRGPPPANHRGAAYSPGPASWQHNSLRRRVSR